MKKIIFIIFILSIALGTLFYLSDISFQLEAFNWKLWLKEVIFFLVIGLISGFISFRHGKRWEKEGKK